VSHVDGEWSAAEGQIIASLSRRPISLSQLLGRLEVRGAGIAGHDELEFGLRRLIASGFIERTGSVFRLTRAGQRIARRGLESAGPPAAPDSWRLDPAIYDTALTDYHARTDAIRARLSRRAK
jgi:hypothetical protein